MTVLFESCFVCDCDLVPAWGAILGSVVLEMIQYVVPK